jgi:isoquinoline 1-oxidoreductase beta subunit
MNSIHNVSRRNFLKAGVGLTVAVMLPACDNQSNAVNNTAQYAQETFTFLPNAFVRIGSDDTVTVVAKHLEMGQGTYTGLATIVAEELDALWSQVEVVAAPADAKRYNNLEWGPYQGTGGSSAISNAYQQMREAGATARAMLVQAAAKLWEVPIDEIEVRNGVLNYRGREVTFGGVVDLAATLDVPTDIKLKDPKDFKLIGKHAPRKDSQAKTNGQAIFTQDIKLDNMLVAVVAHPPKFGATVKAVDDSQARLMNGVVDVVQIPTGVAVVANSYWMAKKGRDALEVTWDESKAYQGSSEQIIADYKVLAQKPGLIAKQDGDALGLLKKAKKNVITHEYTFPFLAHAAMEPMNCVIQFKDGRCEVWNGNQLHSVDQFALSAVFGIKPGKVNINTLFAGGSFGRRGNSQSDYQVEAANIVKALKTEHPVKLVWSREDDMRAGYYRPIYVHKLSATLDAQGLPKTWHHTIVGQSIAAGTAFEGMMVQKGVDTTSVEGANNLPYAIPNMQVDLHTTNASVGVPILWWRSVGGTHTAYSTEVFIDQLAKRAGIPPIAYRLSLLKDKPRHAAVLKLASEKASTIVSPEGTKHGQGVAVHKSFNTYIAHIVDVTIDADGHLKVDRVVCAVDCGVAVNPDVIRAQIEGSVGFALTAALTGEITLENGAVKQGNFDTYPALRINDMPKVEVYITPSAENPTGIGEPGVPPFAPALANAIFAATGKHITQLPIGDQLKNT